MHARDIKRFSEQAKMRARIAECARTCLSDPSLLQDPDKTVLETLRLGGGGGSPLVLGELYLGWIKRMLIFYPANGALIDLEWACHRYARSLEEYGDARCWNVPEFLKD